MRITSFLKATNFPPYTTSTSTPVPPCRIIRAAPPRRKQPQTVRPLSNRSPGALAGRSAESPAVRLWECQPEPHIPAGPVRNRGIPRAPYRQAYTSDAAESRPRSAPGSRRREHPSLAGTPSSRHRGPQGQPRTPQAATTISLLRVTEATCSRFVATMSAGSGPAAFRSPG